MSQGVVHTGLPERLQLEDCFVPCRLLERDKRARLWPSDYRRRTYRHRKAALTAEPQRVGPRLFYGARATQWHHRLR